MEDRKKVKIEGMKKNYGLATDIEEELKHLGIEKILDSNANNNFEFPNCEG